MLSIALIRARAAALAVCVLAGCAAGIESLRPSGASLGGASIPHRAVRAMSVTARARSSSDYLYVVDTSSNAVNVYHAFGKNPDVLRSISNFPDLALNVCVDNSGTLYVVGYHFVYEYDRGADTPKYTITSVGELVACAVDSDGDLYVSQEGNGSGSGTWAVYEFPPQSSTPSRTLTGIEDPFGLALDRKNNLFVADFGSGKILVYRPGATQPSRNFTIPGGAQPGDLSIGHDGVLYVASYLGSNSAVLEYQRKASEPFQEISNLNMVLYLVVGKRGRLYVNEVLNGTPRISEYAHLKTTRLKAHVSKGLIDPHGIALDEP